MTELLAAVFVRSLVTLRGAHRRSRGYTVVELMMALTIMTIGFGGIIAMQKVTVASNMNAKNVALATHVGQSLLDELEAESTKWNRTNDFDNTVWLKSVGNQGTAAAWFAPDYDANRRLGQGYDALGNAVPDDDIEDKAEFCAQLRLTWLGAQDVGKLGGGLIRAEVRVYWRREGIGYTTSNQPKSPCVTPQNFDEWAGAPRFHVVYLSTALRQSFGGS